MITLEHDSLVFRFPEVHEHAKLEVNFQRTCRVPDDDGEYPLPAGLGRFAIRHVDDFADRLDDETRRRGGVLLPMHSSEAMWVNFPSSGRQQYPFALKVAAGKVNALTGAAWQPALAEDPQDYIVVPTQPWLDGFAVEEGVVRQFIAERLGAGYSVEEQLTGKADFGGIQIIAYPMKGERYEALVRQSAEFGSCLCEESVEPSHAYPLEQGSMGLAAGGRISQHLYEDPYGMEAWDQTTGGRCFITLIDSMAWQSLTGEPVPAKALSAQEYGDAGIPWFDYYAPEIPNLGGSTMLRKIRSLAKMKAASGELLRENDSITPSRPVALRGSRPNGAAVRETDI